MLCRQLFATIFIAALEGSSCSEAAFHGKKRLVKVRVLQRHGRPSFRSSGTVSMTNASTPTASTATEPPLPNDFDEVTVEFLPTRPVELVELRLPERQQCDATGSCTGYCFRMTSNKGCFLQKGHGDVLPDTRSSRPEYAMDLVGNDMIKRCVADNEVGNSADVEQLVPKRSTATLQLNAAKVNGSTFKRLPWQFFTIIVQNPPRTPDGNDIRGNLANEFQLVFKGVDDSVVGSAAYKAVEIAHLWFCSYTPWVLMAPCSANCGGGKRFSVRKLLHPPPKGYDQSLLVGCDEGTQKTEPCNEVVCDVDCQLGDWVEWADGPCSTTCGGGVEVQRRRVIVGPSGNGKKCPKVADPLRVRYKECNNHTCEPRCEALGALWNSTEREMIVEGPCSERCGGGNQSILRASSRRDSGVEDTQCATRTTVPCNQMECKELSLFSGRPDLLPLVGKWFEVHLVFFLSNLAGHLELRPPRGFSFGQGKCKLVEHNLPRLRGCKITELGDKRQMAVFEFLNPLEPHRPDTGTNEYDVRLWVKHPEECSADPDCKDKDTEAEREWTLRIQSSLPFALWESIHSSYEIYRNEPNKRRGATTVGNRSQVVGSLLASGQFRVHHRKAT